MTPRIAYFVNTYPAISHSFIRREIHGLEKLGFEVERVALRGWEGELVDEIDFHERSIAHYILRLRPGQLAKHVLGALTASPKSFFSAFWLMLRTGWRGARPLPYHFGYFVEACALLAQLQQEKVEHVHAHFGTNSAEIVMLARALGGPPYSFTVHGPEEFDSPRPLALGEKVRRAAFVVAITSYARAQLNRWVEHAYWHKIKVVHCGLEADFFDAAEETSIPTVSRFVCIGRLNEQKGQLLLLEAARILKERGAKFEITLVGGGELRNQLDTIIGRYGLENHVRLTGAISTESMREEILRSRALVLPSFAEGLPMVIMEAMALRRPVLTTYVAGIPELVRPGENGWLIPAGSVDLLVEAMELVMAASPEELQAMGENAWIRARERHLVDNQAHELARLITASATGSVELSAAESVKTANQ